MFALVDYEKTPPKAPQSLNIGIKYNFEVEYLRALFTNSELRSFSCQINLTINNLFDTEVNQEQQNTGAQAARWQRQRHYHHGLIPGPQRQQ